MENYVKKALSVAFAEVGYREKKTNSQLDSKTANAGSGNYTKYWRDLCPSGQTGAWCQCFIDWVFCTAYGEAEGKRLLGQSDWTYYTPYAVQLATAKGIWHLGIDDIMEGDVIYFYGYVKSEKKNRIHHVGLVYKVTANKVFTVEGNAGDGVNFREYLRTDLSLYGYIRPEYDDEPEPEELVGWHLDRPGGWWYRHTQGRGVGTYYQNGFYNIDGAWYAFDRDGYLIYDINLLAIDQNVGAIYVR